MRRLLAWILVCVLVLPGSAFAQAQDHVTIARETVEQIFEGNAAKAYARFTPEMKAAITLDALKTMMAQLEDMCGTYTGIEAVEDIDVAVIIRVGMAKMPVIAQVSIDRNGFVQGLGITPIQEEQARAERTLEQNEEAVAVGEYKLDGVLTMPEGEKLPAVVLVHGSGPNDRDETVGDTAIFRDLAEGLSSVGIAVLRYDKRSYAMNRGIIPVTPEEIEKMTVYDDTIEDAVAAVMLLKADPRIDPERIYVIGHSQGAMLAGRIQAEARASGLVLLAGTMRNMCTLMAEQLEALGADSFAEQIALARALPDMTEEETAGLTLIGAPVYIFWEEAQHDLKAVYDAVDVPMLVIQGQDDTQVYADRDYPLWEAFAREHPEKDVELRLYEGLGHMLTEGTALSPLVLEEISAWILSR